ncbi:MAG: excinuclease ABC subunit A [Planctomycetota bacterium]|nr:MAG: excinuclease ABC subunit A [Planctomycetota bacterium]
MSVSRFPTRTSVPRNSQRAAIRLRGVRQHNLKNVDVDIPRGQLVAVCGVSGSGKTSLALDTLYAEGQRRYIESFSAYTRQFLERIPKPDFDSIEGLPPSLAVTRSRAARGNRSTVGTASESLDYLRLAMSHLGELTCFGCGRPIRAYAAPQVASLLERWPPDWKLMIAFPVEWQDAAERATVLADLQAQGFVRLVAGQKMLQLTGDRAVLAAHLPQSGGAWVIVDRLRGGQHPERSTASLESAFEHASGCIGVFIAVPPEELERWSAADAATPSTDPAARPMSANASAKEAASGVAQAESAPAPLPAAEGWTLEGQTWSLLRLSNQLRCVACQIDYPEPRPPLFSFNHALGACPQCEGFGDTIEMDLDLIVPDKTRSIEEGAIACWNSPAYLPWLEELMDEAEQLGIRLDVPFQELSEEELDKLIHGDPDVGFEGLDGFFEYLDSKKYKMHVRIFAARWRSYRRCTACGGARLNPQALSFRLAGYNMAELCDLKVDQLLVVIRGLQMDARQAAIANPAVEQLVARLEYLQRVGLGYLQLSRPLRTLSGGEAQRASLAAALGSSLCHMLYVLDEPSVGLHPHDVDLLADAIERLVRRGNTVLVVEHEEALLRRADTVIEVGPDAGARGGQIQFCGSQDAFQQSPCLTADFLLGRRFVPLPPRRRRASQFLEISGCRGHNLQNISARIPLGVLCVVTGVSGSGKSSLVQDTLYPAIANRLTDMRLQALPYDALTGVGQLQDCIFVDQSPVSRSPRSIPVTYIKALDEIRQIFARTPDARLRGFAPGHFSFNSNLGRCDHCQGDGFLQVDMQFLADIQMECPSCHGRRFRAEILQVRFRGQSIADVLEMTATEARDFFRGEPKIQKRLQVLIDVGLGYLPLGQPATTLSAGEAQRLKLAGFLAAATRKKTLFLLDEPTTGLHPRDVVQLLSCFDALLERGHSFLVVEHNLHLIAAADHLIDLGPGAAEAGGYIVAEGTPEQVAAHPDSITGRYLAHLLQHRQAESEGADPQPLRGRHER